MLSGNLTLIIEPVRSRVANSCALVNRVIDVKENGNKISLWLMVAWQSLFIPAFMELTKLVRVMDEFTDNQNLAF